MQISFYSTHLSIKSFPTIDLPPFTVITGANGTGKSHVLKALKDGRLRTTVTADAVNEIRLFEWSTFFPVDQGIYDSRSYMSERIGIYQHCKQQLRAYGARIMDAALTAGIDAQFLTDVSNVANYSVEQIAQMLRDSSKAPSAKQLIQQAANEVSQQIRSSIGNHQHQILLDRLARENSKSIAALTQADFYAFNPDRWGKADLFQQNLGQVFSAYRDLALENRLKQLDKKEGRGGHDALAEDEFVAAHMIPPWDFVNAAIKDAGLDFSISPPNLNAYGPFQPMLKKISTGAEIFFDDLSSGEKVLMSLALSVYQTQDTRQLTSFPKLLLLDEIDAPLHPSMSRIYLKVISDTLVAKHGINVIATTHSPSTVALCNAETLYAMESGHPGLHKIDKSRALNILTDGVPTLGISYDGRRQVFVESYKDAKLYDAIYQIVKAKLSSARSLQFIATGIKSPKHNTEMHSGCEVVRHLVQNLVDAGNNSIFGLIDWDGKNDPSNRMVVIAHQRRNGLENLVLDPITLAALIIREGDKLLKESVGIEHEITYPKFLNASPSYLQTIADNIQNLVLKNPSATTFTGCAYLGGFSLNLLDEYLSVDDHILAEKVVAAFPFLKRHRNELLFSIADTVFKDQPGFIPIEIFDCFNEILKAETHLDTGTYYPTSRGKHFKLVSPDEKPR